MSNGASSPKHIMDNILLRYALVFSPIALLCLQSFFSYRFNLFLAENIGENAWWLYWLIRGGLFAAFYVLVLLFAVDAKTTLSSFNAWDDRSEPLRRAYDPLLGLRAMAFMFVFLGHWFLVVFAPAAPASNGFGVFARSLLSASPWGGVWIFFTLSGYLMGKGFASGRHTVSRAGITTFYRNRALRILPLYLISIFLVSVLVKPENLNLLQKDSISVLLSSLLLDVQDGGIIGGMWSVSTECQFYLLVPLLFLLISFALKNTRQYATVAVFWIVASAFLKLLILKIYKEPWVWHAYIYYPLFMNLDCFLAGVLTAFVVRDLKCRGVSLRRGLPLGGILMVVLYLVLSLWSYPEMVVFQGLPGSATRPYFLCFAPGFTALFTAAIIGVFEMAERKEPTWKWGWRVQSILGTLTYSLYVWHEPVLLSLRRLFPEKIDFLEAIAIAPFGMIVVLIVATLFYHAVETRFDQKRS